MEIQMRFCVAGSVKQGRWEPDRFHQTKALSLGFGFCGCFCWSWGKVWQTEGFSQSVILHAEASSNTFPCKSPQSRRQRENEPALNEQLSAQWHALPYWTDVRQFPIPACWTWTQMAKDHMYNMGRHMYESTPNRKPLHSSPKAWN